MALILHIETTSKNCSVAISNQNELLCLCEEVTENFSHSKKLHTFIQWALEGAEISLQDLEAISVSKGPGSYTGLRIGVSAAKGLAFSLGIPLLSTQTLKTLAFPYFKDDFDGIIASIDAKRNEVFMQEFSKNGHTISEVQNIEITATFFEILHSKKVLFVGNGSDKIKQISLENAIDISLFEFKNEIFPSAQNAIEEAFSLFQDKQFEDTAYFEPFYAKEVHITPSKKKEF